MQRVFKKLAVLATLVATVQMSHGFALLGPFEPYHNIVIGYAQPYTSFVSIPGAPVALQDLGGPHEYAEEFRRNVPVLYYAFDDIFWNFFGSNGVAAVDQAFNIMNSLTNVSAYSPELFEFPLQAQRINYQAQNLALTDLKSTTLHLIVEQMGLAQPERYSWTLHDRFVPPGCPVTTSYLVSQRNYELVPSGLNQYQTSAYVNGTLYTYGIIEFCSGSPTLAFTVPYAVDPTAETYTAVAADAAPQNLIVLGSLFGFNSGGVGLHTGGFYNYLTRDDVGGLRYLLGKSNYNIERSGVGTVQFVTNNAFATLTNMFDLGLFAAQAATNNAATLQALYPGLVVTETTELMPTLGWTTNISLVATSSPFWPAGTIAIVPVTNRDPVLVQHFVHRFGNIITNSFSKKTTYRTQTVSPGSTPFVPAGSGVTLSTNTSKSITVNSISGSFYLLPTNLCAIKVIANLFTNVVATTNLISSVPVGTDTNAIATFSTITYFTNNWIVYLPITCPENTVGLRQGVERVSFVRRDFDSLIGTFWAPQTNSYTLVELTNSTLRTLQMQRVVTQPDFLFTADDLAVGPGGNNFVGNVFRGALNFNQANASAVAGPGTIESPTTFIFNKVGPIYWNAFDVALFSGTFFSSDQSTAVSTVAWGSFDGTTNDPVIYPNGTSIANFINQLSIKVQPQSLPAGQRGVAYNFIYTNTVSGTAFTNQLSATGGQGPFTWALAPNSGALPTGLSLAADGHINGTPSGSAVIKTYDFTVRATDANARSVDVPLAITIVP